MEYQENPQLKLARDFVEQTACNIFLTGKAGTGKTTFLHQLKQNCSKRMVVLAPTGVAAINAGGVTIHSFFQLPFGPQLPADARPAHYDQNQHARASASRFQHFNREKIKIIKSLDLLVIDEISMVRADLLDAIDAVLKRYRDRYKPFGGVQLLMIGDLQQLSPIVKDDEWELLRNYYDTCFFFSSRALRQSEFISIELTHIFRQQDETFINLLNNVRDNKITPQVISQLNQRYKADFSPSQDDGYITLTTHNHQSQRINSARLDQLPSKPFIYSASVDGEFPEFSFPTEAQLQLKKGAQVMFVKNDTSPGKEFFNGKIGTITSLDEDTVFVQCKGDSEPIAVVPAEWQNCRYTIDEETAEIKETIVGTFLQHPLKLAWAITIHKSQGLTFERAIIDAQSAFSHGQVYVALSRCKTLEGLVLSTPILPQSVKSDFRVSDFCRNIEENQPGETELQQKKYLFQKSLVLELFDFVPIQRNLSYLLKLAHENQSSIDGGLLISIQNLQKEIQQSFVDTAGKFFRQVDILLQESPDVEQNQELQERLRKAASYFTPLFQEKINAVIHNIEIETDNKTVKKQLNDNLERIQENSRVKYCCLKASLNGFSILGYLDARAKASLGEKQKKTGSKVSSAIKGTPHAEFYILLKEWRDKKAAAMDAPEHMVLPLKTMKDIAIQLPATQESLKSIKGMGDKKVKKYGLEILQLTITYRKDKNMEIPLSLPANTLEKPKAKTKEISLELFLSGKSVEQIASERTLAASTVESHLAHFVETGELDVNRFVPLEKYKKISEYFINHPESMLGDAKAAFDEGVSYADLHFVRAHLKFLKNHS